MKLKKKVKVKLAYPTKIVLMISSVLIFTSCTDATKVNPKKIEKPALLAGAMIGAPAKNIKR